MIRTVLQLLATHGYIGSTERPQLNVLGTSLTGVAFEVFSGSRRFLHVKVSDTTSLQREYASLVRARADYGSHVPEPLLYCVHEGLEVMVTGGVHFAPLHASDLEDSRSLAVDRLAAFFEKQARLRDEAQTGSHAAWLRNAIAMPVAEELAGALRPWLESEHASHLAALPHVPQHCDFTDNNLGLADGELVVFDWEDAGASSLHGLDIATLLMSIAGFDRERFASLATAEAGGFARRLTAAAGIPHAVFVDLIPAYLLGWLALKASYSPRLQGRVRALLQSYIAR